MNVHAVFLHYLGDAISSLMVLGAGALIHWFHGEWTKYIDPVSSLIIVGIILWTTVPLGEMNYVILLGLTYFSQTLCYYFVTSYATRT